MAPPSHETPSVDGAQVTRVDEYQASAPAPAPAPRPQLAPYVTPQAQPSSAWMPPPATSPVAHYAGYRLALAIVSLALFIPLAAIALGAATTFNASFGAWLGALGVIGAVVVGVNVAFNYWLDADRR